MKLRIVLPALLIVSGAIAAHVTKESAIALSRGDANIAWGACPQFMPAGCQMAVLHGNPSKDNADVFLKVPAQARIPHHWHTSAERMVLVSGELRVTYDGQAPATLTPGMYAYGPAKVGHEAVCGKGDPCVLFIAFEEPIDAVATGLASSAETS